MKKTYQRLPESELDIMLVLWNGTPPMTRPEIEKVINTRKNLAPTTILSLLTRLESKKFVEVTKQGKMNLYTPFIRGKKSVRKKFMSSAIFLRRSKTGRNSGLWKYLFCIF